MYCTRTVRVTLTYADTLTRGVRVVGYCTCTVRVTLTYTDTLTKGSEGGNPHIVRVLSELLWISEWTADKTRHHWTSLG